MKYTEFTAKTVEEAIEEGLKTLGITRENADIRVLEEGKKKLFSSVKARVAIAEKEIEKTPVVEAMPVVEEMPVEKTESVPVEEKTEITAKNAEMTDGERTVVFLNGLFDLLQIKAKTELVREDEKVEINVTAAKTTSIIGKHGAMLDAIQTLAGAVANTGREEYKRVVVDCENYRDNRENTLNRLAENIAQKAIRYGKKIKLEPMNPYERRIIHAALAEREGVSTQSEGKEPNRYIVIIPDNLEDPDAPALSARNDRRDSRGRNGNKGNNRGGYNRGGRGNYGNKGGYNKKPYNRDRKPTPSNSSTSGGTTLKSNNDFFGIFLGNSGGNDEK